MGTVDPINEKGGDFSIVSWQRVGEHLQSPSKVVLSLFCSAL